MTEGLADQAAQVADRPSNHRRRHHDRRRPHHRRDRDDNPDHERPGRPGRGWLLAGHLLGVVIVMATSTLELVARTWRAIGVDVRVVVTDPRCIAVE